ncbi:unnamed protein product [Prunus brigantina]
MESRFCIFEFFLSSLSLSLATQLHPASLSLSLATQLQSPSRHLLPNLPKFFSLFHFCFLRLSRHFITKGFTSSQNPTSRLNYGRPGMAGVREITAAAEFLQGTNRQSLFLHRNSFRGRSHVLWGTVQSRSSELGFANRRGVSLRCRAQEKPRAVVSGGVSSLVDEQSSLVEKPAAEVIHFYRVPLMQESASSELLKTVQTKISNQIVGLKTEQCFDIGLDSQLSSDKLPVLKWLLQETFEPENLGTESFLEKKRQEGLNTVIVEVGPRLSFTTAWSSNAVSICRACGLIEVTRLERSRRYLLFSKGTLQDHQISEFAAMVHDRMTECVYTQKLVSFETSVVLDEVRHVPVMERGRKALEEINQETGFSI